MRSVPREPNPTIVLPGINGAGPDHWQSRWLASDPSMTQFEPASWDRPELDDWIAALDCAVAAAAAPPLLVAHSLACLLFAHWAARARRMVAGAFLVSIPNPESAAFPQEAVSFGGPPTLSLPFPVIVIASTNDPFGTKDYAETRSRDWGVPLLFVGALGHINAQSGLGDWPQGRMLFEAFRAGTRR